jgi:hypothetical protein
LTHTEPEIVGYPAIRSFLVQDGGRASGDLQHVITSVRQAMVTIG